MPWTPPIASTARRLGRVALGYHLTNGLAAALGLLLISTAVRHWLGDAAAAAASVGVIVCVPPDAAAPVRRKLAQLLPAALVGWPLFASVQALHTHTWGLGLLLLPATFLAFLAGAWGKRGLPIVVSIMFAMLFSMAIPRQAQALTVTQSSLCFALGACAYLLWATVANATLNARYRVQMLADTLLALAALMRAQARQFRAEDDATDEPSAPVPLIGELLQRQAALADQLQTARDLLLESPRTARRQQLAALLLQVLELRDLLLACELDLDALKGHPGQPSTLKVLRDTLEHLALQVEAVADALLWRRVAPAAPSLRSRLGRLLPMVAHAPDAQADLNPAQLVQSLSGRIGHVHDGVHHLTGLARGDVAPDLDTVRSAWHMFVSPTRWSWTPLLSLWRWNAPPLRHAIRATLAIGSAYAVSSALPWVAHDYWILLTIVVVLRGSLAQTLERRNHRVLGTLIGCLLAGGLLMVHPPLGVLWLILTVAQALAHAFAVRHYLLTAVAATVLGLVQAHMLGGGSVVFNGLERVADTLIGVAFAWAFSYLLPSWERHLIPTLVQRTLTAQARHAAWALQRHRPDPGQAPTDLVPDIAWRLARREAYDSLSALVMATQRSLAEPRAVRPPLRPLARLLAHSYQLLAQLTAVKTMLTLQQHRLDAQALGGPLADTAQAIEQALTGANGGKASTGPHPKPPQTGEGSPRTTAPERPQPSDDLRPWAVRRLALASAIAQQVANDAAQVLRRPGT